MKKKYGEIIFLIFFGIMAFGVANIAYNGDLMEGDLYLLFLLGGIYAVFKIWDYKKTKRSNKNNQT